MNASCSTRSVMIPFAAWLAACGGSAATSAKGPGEGAGLKLDVIGEWTDPGRDYPSAPPFVQPIPGDPLSNTAAPLLVVRNATILTAAGKTFERGTIVLRGGAIAAVGGSDVAVPEDAQVIDGTGKFVSPGIIDTHSHIGVYSSPGVSSNSDGNEVTGPNTAEARAAYGYWPQDPQITRAAAGGITAAQILPGSANLIGGHGYTVVMRPGRSADEVGFPGAPPTIKMACGENPKRVYGEKGGPQTRMAVYQAFRTFFQEAAEYDAKVIGYRRAHALWTRKKARAAELDKDQSDPTKRIPPETAPEPPPRNARLETLAAVLRGEVLVQVHCYRADEIHHMVAIADELGFKIRSFHHALEAYKVRDLLVEHDIAISTWADWWAFKMEAFDGIMENAALFQNAGGRPVIHSDSAIGIQRLNQEASKAMWAGRHAGLTITDDQALRWITANAAWVLGIDAITGTLEVGKRADVVVWNAHPLSVYAQPELVLQGGVPAYDRARGLTPTDFELGNSAIDAAIESDPASNTKGGAR